MKKDHLLIALSVISILLSSSIYFLSALKSLLQESFYYMIVGFMLFGIIISMALVLFSMVLRKRLDPRKFRIVFYSNLIHIIFLILFVVFSMFTDRARRPEGTDSINCNSSAEMREFTYIKIQMPHRAATWQSTE